MQTLTGGREQGGAPDYQYIALCVYQLTEAGGLEGMGW